MPDFDLWTAPIAFVLLWRRTRSVEKDLEIIPRKNDSNVDFFANKLC